MTKPRKQHYRRTPGRCQACGSRLVTGDWHRPGSGGSIQCAHCRPKFVSNPENVDIDITPEQNEIIAKIFFEASQAGLPEAARAGLVMRPASKFCESGNYDGCTCDWCR
jgi:hypothetical protein